MEKKLDPFGVLVLSFVTAIGGGTLRDMMIGNLPVSWLTNATATIVIFSSAVVTMLFGRYLRHLTTTLFLFDALGLGLLCAARLLELLQLLTTDGELLFVRLDLDQQLRALLRVRPLLGKLVGCSRYAVFPS